MSRLPTIGETVRVNRPGTTIFTPVVEYHGRVMFVGDTITVLDEERKGPGVGGSFEEKPEHVHVGRWVRTWQDEEG